MMETNVALEMIVRVVSEVGTIGVLLLVLKRLSEMYDVLITLIVSLVDKQTADDEKPDD